MIVEVVHPAAVLHVPPRARAQRLTYVSERTPVEIATVGDGEMRPVSRLLDVRSGYGLYERDGVLWQKLSYMAVGFRNVGITPAEWLAWLTGHGRRLGRTEYHVDSALAMTPLRVYDRAGHADKRGLAPLGLPGSDTDAGALGTITHDARERAARNAARFVSDETLVTDTAVYLRYRPRALRDVAGPVMQPLDRPAPLSQPYLSPRHAIADSASYFMDGLGRGNLSSFEHGLALLEPYVEDDVDARLLGNWLPGWLARSLDERIRRHHPPGTPGREAALEARREAAALAVAGDVGSLDGEDARAAIETVAALASREIDLSPAWEPATRREPVTCAGMVLAHSDQTWAFLARHLGRVLDRNAPAPVPGDDEAMAGLGARP